MNNAVGIAFEITFVEKAPFYSDLQRFKTILENLISNAIKYHTHERDGRFLKIEGVSDKNHLKLILKDNGIGIAPANHKKVFDMFHRISGDIPGSGLGLYIVKETVEKLQGKISMDSSEGTGTTFELQLKNLL